MKRWLKRGLIGVGIILGLLVLIILGAIGYVLASWDRVYDRPVPQVTAPTDPASLARGEYIFKYTALCWGCHGSARDIDAPPAGGEKFDLSDVGPPTGLGIFYASNLTSDVETGLGAWSDGEVLRSLREGLDREGRVLTLMPFQWYRLMSDADLLALVGYIKSLPPARNAVPEKRLSFASKALMAFKLIKPQPSIDYVVTAPAPGPTVEYGRYLASYLSSCGECHTPRNLRTGESMTDRPFTGGNVAFDSEGVSVYASNLTPDREGVRAWGEDQFLAAIRTGVRPDGAVIMPIFMPWLIYRDLSDDDLRAIYRYLRSLPPISFQVPAPQIAPGQAGPAKGRALFQGYCAPCHGKEGEGTFLAQAALRQVAPAMNAKALEQMIGDGIPGTTMPGFARTLHNEDMEALIQFLQTWEGQ